MTSFRTEIKFEEWRLNGNHQNVFLTFGSCFADLIRASLARHFFEAPHPSHGVIYHPTALAQAAREVLNNRSYCSDDLLFHEGLFKSLNHHSAFSARSAQEALDRINHRIEDCHNKLSDQAIIIVTFGSAMAYVHKATNKVVANCHRLPQQDFSRSLTDLDTMISNWEELVACFKEKFPKLQWIFTVSPVRHLKEGFIENQRSKARLIMLCEALSNYSNCHYFPSYEIMMDDLRDYRFYGEDFIHPTSFAVEYIRSIFYKNTMSESTLNDIKQMEPFIKTIEHRGLHENTEQTEKRKAAALEEVRLILNR